VPSTADIWDFLVNLKDATEAGINRLSKEVRDGFARVDSDIAGIKSDITVIKSEVTVIKSDMSVVKNDMQRIERRLVRSDDRITALEGMNTGHRLDDHERRIARLESQGNTI
jgi:hypothetical protein